MYCLQAIVAMNANNEEEARATWRRLVEQNVEREPPPALPDRLPPAPTEVVPTYYY
jgi:hypothetical protein